MRMRDTINCYLVVPVHRFVNNCIIHAGYGFECAVQKTVAIESHIEISVTTVFIVPYVTVLLCQSFFFQEIMENRFSCFDPSGAELEFDDGQDRK